MKKQRDMDSSSSKNWIGTSQRKTSAVTGELGQMTLEMILLMTVLVGIAIAATKGLRDNQILAKMVGQPWQVVQGMIEDGVWMKAGDLSKKNNPGNFNRRVSALGDKP